MQLRGCIQADAGAFRICQADDPPYLRGRLGWRVAIQRSYLFRRDAIRNDYSRRKP